jgi:hypothetical protein
MKDNGGLFEKPEWKYIDKTFVNVDPLKCRYGGIPKGKMYYSATDKLARRYRRQSRRRLSKTSPAA